MKKNIFNIGNSNNLKLLRIPFIYYLILAGISLFIFTVCIVKSYPDIPIHNQYAYELYNGKQVVPIHFLYFIILMVPELLFNGLGAIHVFSVLILTVCVLFKYKISRSIFSESLLKEHSRQNEKNFIFLTLTVPFLLMICQNMIYKPSATMFLGYLPVNTWHNSTTIFLMPFALLLFYRSYQYICVPDSRKLVQIIVLTVLNLIIKPSFLISFVCVFPLFSLFKFKFSKHFFYCALVSLIGLSGLFCQAMIGSITTATTEVTLKLSPFNVWAHWSNNIPMSFIFSLLFPLTFLVFYFNDVRKDLLLKYGWALFGIGLLFFIFISESGIREFDGNFAWQVIICNYMLFLSTAISFVRQLMVKMTFSKKDLLVTIIFLMHVLTGCVYILKSPVYNFR